MNEHRFLARSLIAITVLRCTMSHVSPSIIMQIISLYYNVNLPVILQPYAYANVSA